MVDIFVDLMAGCGNIPSSAHGTFPIGVAIPLIVVWAIPVVLLISVAKEYLAPVKRSSKRNKN